MKPDPTKPKTRGVLVHYLKWFAGCLIFYAFFTSITAAGNSWFVLLLFVLANLPTIFDSLLWHSQKLDITPTGRALGQHVNLVMGASLRTAPLIVALCLAWAVLGEPMEAAIGVTAPWVAVALASPLIANSLIGAAANQGLIKLWQSGIKISSRKAAANFLLACVAIVFQFAVLREVAHVASHSYSATDIFYHLLTAALIIPVSSGILGRALAKVLLEFDRSHSNQKFAATAEQSSRRSSAFLFAPLQLIGGYRLVNRFFLVLLMMIFCATRLGKNHLLFFQFLWLLCLLPLLLDSLLHTLRDTSPQRLTVQLHDHQSRIMAAFLRLCLFLVAYLLLQAWIAAVLDLQWQTLSILAIPWMAFLCMAALKVLVVGTLASLAPNRMLWDFLKAPSHFWLAVACISALASLSEWVFVGSILSEELRPALPNLILSSFGFVYLSALAGCLMGRAYHQKKGSWKWKCGLTAKTERTISQPKHATPEAPVTQPSKSLNTPAVTAPVKQLKTGSVMSKPCPECNFNLMISGISVRRTHPWAKFLTEHQLILSIGLGVALVVANLKVFKWDPANFGTNDAVWLNALYVFVPFFLLRGILLAFPKSRIIDCPKCGFHRQEPIEN